MHVFRVAILVLSTLFGACTIFAQSGGGQVDFTTILKSTESQLGDCRDQVISSTATWVRFWEELYPDAETRPSLPEVDFTQRMVIVVAMGEEPTGNFDIRVTKLVRIKGVSKGLPLLKVLIEETRPKPSCFPLPSATQPIHVIETDRVFDVTFRRILKTDRCGG